MGKRSFLNQEIFNDILKSVNAQTKATEEIYGCKDKEALAVFANELTGSMVETYHAQLKQNENYYLTSTSAGNMPTRNIRDALVESEISEDGLLPENRCYLSQITEGKGHKIDEDKYNEEKNAVEERIAGVTAWVQKHPDTDPNLFELMDIFVSAGKYGKEISSDTKKDLQYLKTKRMKDLVDRVGIKPEDELYKMCDQICNNTLRGIPTTFSSNVQQYICKLTGVNLYIGQMKRDDKNFAYNNIVEVSQMAELKKKSEEQEMLPIYSEGLFNSISQLLVTDKDKDEEKDKNNELDFGMDFFGDLQNMTVNEIVDYQLAPTEKINDEVNKEDR